MSGAHRKRRARAYSRRTQTREAGESSIGNTEDENNVGTQGSDPGRNRGIPFKLGKGRSLFLGPAVWADEEGRGKSTAPGPSLKLGVRVLLGCCTHEAKAGVLRGREGMPETLQGLRDWRGERGLLATGQEGAARVHPRGLQRAGYLPGLPLTRVVPRLRG